MTLLVMDPKRILERIAPEFIRPLAEVQREKIESALILCQGNVAEAARRLGISRAQIYRLVRIWRKDDA